MDSLVASCNHVVWGKILKEKKLWKIKKHQYPRCLICFLKQNSNYKGVETINCWPTKQIYVVVHLHAAHSLDKGCTVNNLSLTFFLRSSIMYAMLPPRFAFDN